MSLFTQFFAAAVLASSVMSVQALPVSTHNFAAKSADVGVVDHVVHAPVFGSAGSSGATFVSASAHKAGSPVDGEVSQSKVWLLLFAAAFASTAVLRRRQS